MVEIVALIIPLFGLIGLGVLAGMISKRPLDEMGWLNIFIIYVALPALFIRLLSKTPVEKLASWDFILTTTGVTFGIVSFTFLIGLIESRGRVGEAAVQGLAGSYGNIGYMGPGIAILVFGEAAAVPVALIFCFENILHFIFAPTMMALSGEKKRSLARLVWGIARQIVLHPFILATAAGVGLAMLRFTPPAPVEALIAYLSQAAAPCALFAMGVTLARRPLRRVPLALGYIVPIKLILHPAAMYGALAFAGPFDPTWMFTAVLLAALPTATNVFVIAQQYGVWVERASATVLVTTVLSVLSVSVLLYAITQNLIPGAEIG